jgi:hypothetical protein
MFGALVGAVDHITFNPRRRDRPDDNHIYLWLRINTGQFEGRYECAVNIKSTRHTAPVEYAVREEVVAAEELPQPGFYPSELSYSGLGLRQGVFQSIEDRSLSGLVQHNAETCDFACAFGRTYSNWNGMHDIHLNWGEPTDSPYRHKQKPNGDGALSFYFLPPNAPPHRRWIFIKFATQLLPP